MNAVILKRNGVSYPQRLPKSHKRVHYIDIARGIGIILVVLGHVIQNVQYYSTISGYIERYIYSFHMPLFFVISGFLLFSHFKKRNFQIDMKQELVNRSISLLRPYFIWSMIYILLDIAISLIMQRDTIGMILERCYATFTGRGIAPLWFLASLFIGECICCIMILCTIKIGGDGRPTIILLIATLSCLGLINIHFHLIYVKYSMQELNPTLSYWIISLFRSVLAIFFIWFGICIGWFICKVNHICRYLVYIACFCIWLLAEIINDQPVNMHLYEFDSIAQFMLTGVTGSIWIMGTSRLLLKSNFFEWFGRNSLKVMVLHYPPIPIIYILVRALMSFCGPLRTILVMIGTLLCVYIIIRLLEKMENSCRLLRMLF